MRVLVCGGRDYADKETIAKVLDSLKIDLLINGAAKGADTLSGQWAEDRNISCLYVPALWDKEGKRAGILRNLRMLHDGDPEMVVAFPGS